MRLLFVVHQFMPEFASGTEQVTLALAKAVQRAGHRAEILTCSLDPNATWDGATPEGFRRTGVDGLVVSGIPRAMLPDTFGLPDAAAIGPQGSASRASHVSGAIDAFLSRGNYDLVHVTHSMRMLDVVARVRAAGLPYLLTLTDFFLLCHRINLVRRNGAHCAGPEGGRACATYCRPEGTDLLALEQRQDDVAAVLRHAAVRVACSPFVASAFAREHPDLPVSVIGHGIDLLRMRPREARSTGETVLGYVGTMSQEKGVDVLARAFAAAPLAATRLELVGPSSGDPAFDHEIAWLAQHDPRIRLRGGMKPAEMPRVLAGLDVLCLPTRLPETFSLALHEGFAAGLPALVSDLGHPAGVVREQGCGLVLPDGDQAAWTAAIERVAGDPGVLESWRAKLPLPARIEEETFLYSQLYKACIA